MITKAIHQGLEMSLRYAASRSVDLADTQVLLGSKGFQDTRNFSLGLADSRKFRQFYLDVTQILHIFFLYLMMLQDTRIFSGTKNRATPCLTVFSIFIRLK